MKEESVERFDLLTDEALVGTIRGKIGARFVVISQDDWDRMLSQIRGKSPFVTLPKYLWFDLNSE